MARSKEIFDTKTNKEVNSLIQQRHLKTHVDQTQKDGLKENPIVKWILGITIAVAIIIAVMQKVYPNLRIITYFRPKPPPKPTKFQLFLEYLGFKKSDQ